MSTPLDARPEFSALQEYGVSAINDALKSVGVFALLPYRFECIPDFTATLVGTAATAVLAEGDNLGVYELLEVIRPGEVMVLQSSRSSGRSGMCGELIALAARELEIAGIVANGAVRDYARLARVGLPIWHRGRFAGGSVKRSTIGVNIAMAMGSVIVTPGDVVLADADGVLAFRFEYVNRAL